MTIRVITKGLQILITRLIFLHNDKASTFYVGDFSLVKHRQENMVRKT